MACLYGDENLEKFRQEIEFLYKEESDLDDRIFLRHDLSKEGREYAIQGLKRGIDLLLHSIRFTYETIPPSRMSPPSDTEKRNATLAIQAFYTNIFGALDNIGRIWAEEKPELSQNNCPLGKAEITIFPKPKNKVLYRSFPEAMQKAIDESTTWFNALTEYRDGLAHRIPLYIPPGIIDQKDASKYQQLDEAYWRARINGDPKADTIFEEQMKLTHWRPFMTHSFGENAKPIMFHPQMIIDLKTIFVLTNELFDALDMLVKPN